MAEDRLKLEDSWKAVLHDEFAKPYMNELRRFLQTQKRSRKVVYPRDAKLWNGTPSDDIIGPTNRRCGWNRFHLGNVGFD